MAETINGPRQRESITCPDYVPIELYMDELYEAREAWERAEYLITPRVMARVGIDEALDKYNEERRRHGSD